MIRYFLSIIKVYKIKRKLNNIEQWQYIQMTSIEAAEHTPQQKIIFIRTPEAKLEIKFNLVRLCNGANPETASY